MDTKSWGLMNERERGIWLTTHVLGEARDADVDSNLLAECEAALNTEQAAQYVTNCLSEASSIAYRGLSAEQVQQAETAMIFYRVLLTLPVENRALSMYWAILGEGV